MKYIIGYFRKCDMLTMLGTTIAFIGMCCAFNGHFSLASLCLMLSGICDSFDGTLARKYKYDKSQQEYGVQLDSLSDVICFGILPAIITVLISTSIVSVIICIFYMLCGVIRLAYFNMLHTTKAAKKGEYIGLPITSIAIAYPIILIILRILNPGLLSKVMPAVLLIMGSLFIARFKLKKPNVPKIAAKILNKYTTNLILFPLFIVIAGDIFYRMTSNNVISNLESSFYTIVSHFLPFILIYIMVALLFIIINSITNNSKITKILLLIVSLIIFVINDIKLNIMGIPIELSDVGYLNPDNMGMMATATTTIGSWIWLTVIKGIIFVALSVGIIFADKLGKFSVNSIVKRIVTFLIGTILIALIGISMTKKYTFFIEKIYNADKEILSEYISVDEYTNEYGFFQGIILTSLVKKDLVSPDYSSKYVSKLLSSYDDVTVSGKWGKANVVFILSEAFSDLENISEITFNEPLMQEIANYKKDNDKMVFDLLVPAYGGSSVNTEFEILTGASLTFWSPGFIPYNQYYSDSIGKNAPNIIKEFNNNGYTTMYLTPWGEDSYNSKRNYKLFGADKTIYGSKLKGSNKGQFYSDKSLMKDIYNQLKNTKEGEYKFIMTASGQNHFPYTEDKYEKYDISVKNTEYSKKSTNMLKSYAQGVYDASKELNNLYKMIQDLDTPTIIVFFGDHLPYIIDDDGVEPYISAKYFNTENKYVNDMRKHTTKAVILSNYDIETDDIKYMNANYLGAYVLNKMDLKVSNYFKYIDDLRKKVPVYNRNAVYMNNNTALRSDLDYNAKKALEDYKFVQYGSFYENIK
ncbi:MAG: sulfatase-like hydrolase/transferase [Bacilli bacterium]|nr:sulfatase-like hydrolase/transferase [bacterium]MDY2697442.1 sulfatase-like hydrolase/transferase [Bacilli bacterium]